MVVVQISRGVCPARCIQEMIQSCQRYGWHYEPMYEKPLVEAKNAAVEIAMSRGEDLLIVEDDILVPADVWSELWYHANMGIDTILYAECTTRAGISNVHRSPSGKFMKTGNVFVYVPHQILAELRRPVFRAYNYIESGDGEELIPFGPDPLGRRSDAWFWHHVTKAGYPVACVGRVMHLRHPMNDQKSGTYDNIYVPTEWGKGGEDTIRYAIARPKPGETLVSIESLY